MKATATPIAALARQRAVALLRNREALTVLAFSGLSVVGGLVGNRLLTQVASPDSLGELYLFTNLAQWLSLPTAAGFIYVTHHWPIAREHGATEKLVRGIRRGLAVQAAIGIAGAAVFGILMREVSRMTAIVIALLCISTSVYQALVPIPNTERRRVANGILGLLGGAGRQFALTLGVVAFAAGTGVALLATTAAYQTLAAAVAVLIFSQSFRAAREQAIPLRETDQVSVRAFLLYSVPGVIAALAAQIASSAERWGLAQLDRPATTALFVQSLGISMAATGAVASVIMTYFYPFITDAAARGGADPLGAAKLPLRRLFVATAVTQAVLALCAILFVRQVTALAFSARFSGVAALLPWTTLGAGLFAIGQSLAVALFTARDAVWPNASRVASQLLYAGGLIALPHTGNPARSFAQLFVLGQACYVGLQVWALGNRVRQRRRALGAT